MEKILIWAAAGAVIAAVWHFIKKGQDARQAGVEQQRREAFNKSNEILGQLNKSLGYPEGQGPTGIMVDGEYRVVNVGHTERLKNEPAYAFGNQMADVISDLQSLEAALGEAEVSGDHGLAAKIRAELARRNAEGHALMDQYQAKKTET